MTAMKIIKWIANKPTLFFVLGLITIIISIPAFFYIMRLNGGASLGAIFPMYAIMISVPVIIIDRLLVTMIRPLTLSIIEICVVLLLIIYIKYDSRSVIIDMTDGNQQYLLIKYDTTGQNINDFSHYGLFDKKIKLNKEDLLILNKSSLGQYDIKLNPPKYWRGYGYTTGGDNYGYNYEFYTGCIGTTKIDLNDMDSIINSRAFKKK